MVVSRVGTASGIAVGTSGANNRGRCKQSGNIREPSVSYRSSTVGVNFRFFFNFPAVSAAHTRYVSPYVGSIRPRSNGAS